MRSVLLIFCLFFGPDGLGYLDEPQTAFCLEPWLVDLVAFDLRHCVDSGVEMVSEER